MADKMMICKEGHPDCLCRHKKPHKYSNDCKQLSRHGCKACIPYEPEIIPITICFKCGEYFKGSDKVCIQDGKIYHTQCLHILEPQPATCPECGHPTHEKICHVEIDTRIGHYKLCQCTLADLQPKHCTAPEGFKCFYKHGNCNGIYNFEPCSYYKVEQPTQMPHTQRCPTCGRITETVEESLIIKQFFHDYQQAHDSAIAAQERREFAEKCVKTMPDLRNNFDIIINIGKQYDACIAHIRKLGGLD